MATSFGKPRSDQVNNDIYDTYGDRWYHAKDDPVALLRAESRTRNPWVVAEIQNVYAQAKVLDIGCGAGLLTNELARQGMDVTGFDASAESLEVARRYDATARVQYQLGDANQLPYAQESFDVVCAMDFLEHVEDPAQIVAEAARVLRPGGLFFFHTFSRNFIAWLIGIKGVEWFVKNTPPNLHSYRYFIKPAELTAMCERNGFQVKTIRGLEPVIMTRAFWKMLVTGVVEDDFRFRFSNSKLIGYTGLARKQAG
jgi:2-polyprenyl-6-hydroxyphenyl methylase/3-demethylubiquinone-9 3-methyltransferase